jgi:Xaa-Pro aminopeptidase
VPGAVLIHADSLLDANMFVATGVAVGDPFTYIESGDRRIIVTNQLEVDLVRRESTATDIWMVDEFGGRDLVRDGWPPVDARMETVLRMLQRAELDAVAVAPSFPLALADYLRGQGITLTPDRVLFESRQRHKDARQLQGVRAAQRATEAAFDAARGMIGSASPDPGGALQLHGETLTCERVRAAVVDTLRERGCGGEPPIVAAGPQGALGPLALARTASMLGEGDRNDDALTLQVPSDGGVRSLRALLDRLDAEAIEVAELSVQTPELDDVFLALTGRPHTHDRSLP